ncbi:zinc-dependent metalloprotease [uncultured Formosa sp.]|uniref:zinc-dependent metalloprotease n=1 Tax=uncultured Formosa sp. TaxID=255435 RepID=UPI002618C80C|nr:zinc-dependent metalloprotease [uncultured Formosa sp.]
MRSYLYFLVFIMHYLMFCNVDIQAHGIIAHTGVQFNSSNSGFIEARLEGKVLYLGIPKTLLNLPMLFVNHQDGARLENKYVLWNQYGHKLYLESPGTIMSTSGIRIPTARDASISDKIIATFPIIKSKSDTNTLWIEANDLFLKDLLTGWSKSENQKIITSESSIKTFTFFENELVVKVNQVTSGNQSTWRDIVDYSLFLLPKPMKSRAFDHRMGFFSEDIMNFNPINYKAETPKANIGRWRLEKKYKDSVISDPVKPITFLLSNAIPKTWRPYVKAGILEWLPAFEAAGFKNALIVKENMSKDSNVDFNSVNHNIVTWGNKRNLRGFENKSGSSAYTITDLRSGEILKANLAIGSSYQSLMDEYIIRCAPLDDRAHQYPLPDDLLGVLIQSLVAHESGHAFGLMDAHYGEYAYPFEKMRDKDWLEEMGHTPSIMTYARHNYIAQPEDGIPPDLLIQKVGPTDVYNIRWAYKPLDTQTPKEEKTALEAILRVQDTVAWYRYNKGQSELIGPGSTDDVVESNDPIQSTKLGLKNMKRVLELLPTINKSQPDYAVIERLYEKTLDLWFKEMRQVLSLIGGYTIYYKSGNQIGEIYSPIMLNIQNEAIDFFCQQAFSPPGWLVNPEFMPKFEYSTYPDRLMDFQMRLLMEAINQRRFKRFEFLEQYYVEYEGVSSVFLEQFQSLLFEELDNKTIQINTRKKELQKLYVDALITVINQKFEQLNAPGNTSYTNYTKSLFMKGLLQLKLKINKCITKKTNPVTYGHLKLLLRQLNEIN